MGYFSVSTRINGAGRVGWLASPLTRMSSSKVTWPVAIMRAGRSSSDSPVRSQQVTLRALGDERISTLVKEYVAAWENADVEAVSYTHLTLPTIYSV